MRIALPLLIALLGTGCMTTGAAGPVTGSWGAQHVGLTLTATGGQLDYDCASGTIDQPLVADARGRFSAGGTHSPGQGGPVQVGQVLPVHPARYSGRVSGDSLTLAVDVPALEVRIGPYTLRRGVEPTLLRCL